MAVLLHALWCLCHGDVYSRSGWQALPENTGYAIVLMEKVIHLHPASSKCLIQVFLSRLVSSFWLNQLWVIICQILPSPQQIQVIPCDLLWNTCPGIIPYAFNHVVFATNSVKCNIVQCVLTLFCKLCYQSTRWCCNAVSNITTRWHSTESTPHRCLPTCPACTIRATVFVRIDAHCAWPINEEKPEKVTSSVSQPKRCRATSAGNQRYYTQTGSIERWCWVMENVFSVGFWANISKILLELPRKMLRNAAQTGYDWYRRLVLCVACVFSAKR